MNPYDSLIRSQLGENSTICSLQTREKIGILTQLGNTEVLKIYIMLNYVFLTSFFFSQSVFSDYGYK